MPTDTPVEAIPAIHARVSNAFHSHKSYPLEFRKQQLRKLYWAMKDHEQAMYNALKADLGKPQLESYAAEVGWAMKDILYTLENLDKWTAESPPEDLEWMFKRLMRTRIRKEPLGAALIIGAYNYPLQLVLVPLIGAISAGCTAVIKPSEMTPASVAILQTLVARLDNDCYQVVAGAIPQTTALLDLKWDKIVYTGSTRVAKVVSTAAVKHLTPVILELGGLNPVLIGETADAKLAAKRIFWSKVHNSGQVCIAADYALIHPSKETEFVEGAIAAIKSYQPNGQDLDGQSRIVNDRHFDRIKGLLDNTQGKILCGGNTDRANLWIEPTLVKVNSPDDPLLSEEIFGPVLPYMTVSGGAEVMVKLCKKIGDTPLALYAFTNDKKEEETILSQTRSGGVTINDTMFHASLNRIPFGGVGDSGSGCYRGKATFDAFTHNRPILNQPSWTESSLTVRYPPYTAKRLKAYIRANPVGTPNFDRHGNIVPPSILKRVAMLGAPSLKRALLRYVLAFVGVWFWFASHNKAK